MLFTDWFRTHNLLTIIIGCMMIFCMVMSMFCWKDVDPIVEFVYKRERPRFIKRKRDDLIINAVVLFVGFMLGWVVNR